NTGERRIELFVGVCAAVEKLHSGSKVSRLVIGMAEYRVSRDYPQGAQGQEKRNPDASGTLARQPWYRRGNRTVPPRWQEYFLPHRPEVGCLERKRGCLTRRESRHRHRARRR